MFSVSYDNNVDISNDKDEEYEEECSFESCQQQPEEQDPQEPPYPYHPNLTHHNNNIMLLDINDNHNHNHNHSADEDEGEEIDHPNDNNDVNIDQDDDNHEDDSRLVVVGSIDGHDDRIHFKVAAINASPTNNTSSSSSSSSTTTTRTRINTGESETTTQAASSPSQISLPTIARSTRFQQFGNHNHHHGGEKNRTENNDPNDHNDYSDKSPNYYKDLPQSPQPLLTLQWMEEAVHALSMRVARITAQLAHETLDRERAFVSWALLHSHHHHDQDRDHDQDHDHDRDHGLLHLHPHERAKNHPPPPPAPPPPPHPHHFVTTTKNTTHTTHTTHTHTKIMIMMDRMTLQLDAARSACMSALQALDRQVTQWNASSTRYLYVDLYDSLRRLQPSSSSSSSATEKAAAGEENAENTNNNNNESSSSSPALFVALNALQHEQETFTLYVSQGGDRALTRALDQVAGVNARTYFEETACRRAVLATAALDPLHVKEQESHDTAAQQAYYLAQIQHVRKLLAHERTARKQRDQTLQQHIRNATRALQNTLLQLVKENPTEPTTTTTEASATTTTTTTTTTTDTTR